MTGIVFGLAVLVTATVGDLAESMIKRDLGIKDMSSWLPGTVASSTGSIRSSPPRSWRLRSTTSSRPGGAMTASSSTTPGGTMTISEFHGIRRPCAALPAHRGRVRGYEPRAVDAFLARARASFETGSEELGADEVRAVAFPLVRRGYVVDAVDAALARIEDAFAQRARAAALERVGARAWVEQTRSSAQTILDRLTRPRKHVSPASARFASATASTRWIS